METLGDDIEKQLWEEAMWAACELEGKFAGWREYSDTKSMCERVHDAWNDIFESDLRKKDEFLFLNSKMPSRKEKRTVYTSGSILKLGRTALYIL
jgi:hypothetical protein